MYDRQLLTFVRVAETGSLTQAAEKLYITPAAVMKQMNALETRLELRLIERSNQGVRLTRAGEYLYGEALKLIAASDAAVERAREIQSREGRVIRVGSSFLNPGRELADWWNRMGREPERFGIKIVPYSDDRERILSVVPRWGHDWILWSACSARGACWSWRTSRSWAGMSCASPYRESTRCRPNHGWR